MVVSQEPAKRPGIVRANVSSFCIYNNGWTVRRGHKAAFADSGEQDAEGVSDPAKGEGNGGKAKRAASCELRNGALHNVAADDGENGEYVPGIMPLRIERLERLRLPRPEFR
jgi:hypothetical protein